MNVIVADFTKFDLLHKVLVYQDGDIIDIKEIKIEDMPEAIKGLRNKYDAQEVNLLGSPLYLSKVKEKLLTEFSNSNTKIIIN